MSRTVSATETDQGFRLFQDPGDFRRERMPSPQAASGSMPASLLH
jgi:hypothetical protein